MKSTTLLFAATAMLVTGACNGQNGSDTGGSGGDRAAEATEAVEPPADGDWSKVVTATSAGGYRMGNPNAEVALVEFGSMTCPHCAEFDEAGLQPLIDNYVKSGKVSFEFRNFVRDPYDIAASLIARCNGAGSFFPLTRGLFNDQQAWVTKVQEAPQERLEALTNMGPDRQFLEIAQLAELQQWAAMRGVPSAKSTTCLTDQAEINRLVEMNSEATSEYPNFSGTPSFVLNGKLLEQTSGWPALEPKIKEALGS